VRKSREHFRAQKWIKFTLFCGRILFLNDVLDVCADVHPLEHAVTIGRTSRTVADGTVVDFRTDLRLFARRSSGYFHGCRTVTTHYLVPALLAGGSGQPAWASVPFCRPGVKVQSSEFRFSFTTYTITRLYSPGFFFYSTRGTILRRERDICRPVSKARTLSCINRLVREASCMRRSAGSEFPLVHVLFLEGSCVWN
jgi:hypothetical protein